MDRPKFLEGQKVFLSPANENDCNLVFAGKNNAAIRETLFLFSPVTFDDAKNEQQQWLQSKEIKLFTICTSEGKAVGQTALVRIDYVSRACVFYIAIYDESALGKGYGGEATQLMLHYTFDILNMNRIQLHVSKENERGVKAYTRAGFKIEGTLRQAMYHHNRYVDFYVMGILRDEYYSK